MTKSGCKKLKIGVKTKTKIFWQKGIGNHVKNGGKKRLIKKAKKLDETKNGDIKSKNRRQK